MMFALCAMAATLLAPVDGPVSPNASPAARKLLAELHAVRGKAMFSGMTDLDGVEHVVKETGRTPKILALDFMHAPRRMKRPTGDTAIAIDWGTRRKGIVAFQWHWVAPAGTTDMGGGFNTKQTTFNLAQTLAHPESDDYREMIRDLDDVAAELRKIADAGVPVLFRPLHEAQGRWFWWGAQGPEACQKLYRLIFDRFTRHHRLNNLLWVWNVYPDDQDKGKAVDWYPGDRYVDIVSTDYVQQKKDYDALVALTGGRKVVGISETMNPPRPGRALAEGAHWSFWVQWAKRDWNAKSLEDVRAALEDPASRNL